MHEATQGPPRRLPDDSGGTAAPDPSASAMSPVGRCRCWRRRRPAAPPLLTPSLSFFPYLHFLSRLASVISPPPVLGIAGHRRLDPHLLWPDLPLPPLDLRFGCPMPPPGCAIHGPTALPHHRIWVGEGQRDSYPWPPRSDGHVTTPVLVGAALRRWWC